MTSLKGWCFYDCSSLESIEIPASVASLGRFCFEGCSSLESIEIPTSVTSLGDHCFYGCSSLVSIDIPSSVISLGYECFSGCASLASIDIPSSVTSIGNYCFSGCTSLESIVVNAGNPCYDSREECNAIIETESNTMLAGCKNTVIPSSVTSLGEGCFRECSSLVSIAIPSFVTSLGEGCFRECSSLVSIAIPSSVTSLGGYCFNDCSSLKTVICKMENVVSNDWFFYNTPIKEATLYVPEHLLETYKSTYPWSNFGTILPLLSLSDVTLFAGEESQILISGLPEYAEEGALHWTTSNDSIVTVDGNGKATGHAIGEVTITATDGSGVTSSCKVTVLPILAESITLSHESWNGEEGESFTLVATVLPENTTDKTVNWSSSDPEIATVDAEGHVSVLKVGYCTITASTQDGSNLSAECIITSASGIDDLFTDSVARFDVYNLQGVLLKKGCGRDYLKQLSTGAYILRQGNVSKKVIIR